MKANKTVVVLTGLVVSGFVLAFAQTSISQLLELEEFPPLNLPSAPVEVASESGNFFSAAHPDWPPLPGLVGARQSLPVYSLAAEFGQPAGAPYYLVDDRQYVWMQEAMAAGLLSGEMMTMNSLEFPGEGEEGGGGWTNNFVSPVYTTNDLWLAWVEGSVTNGQGTLELHIPEELQSETWFIWATTNLSVSADPWALSVSNWTWMAAAEPGQTNITVPLLAADTGFYRLAHPTNDSDFDGLTDYWSWLHFGHALGWASDGSFATNDFDLDGTSNYDEFVAGSNPNDFVATAHFPSLFVNQQTVSGTCSGKAACPSRWRCWSTAPMLRQRTGSPIRPIFPVRLGPPTGFMPSEFCGAETRPITRPCLTTRNSRWTVSRRRW